MKSFLSLWALSFFCLANYSSQAQPIPLQSSQDLESGSLRPVELIDQFIAVVRDGERDKIQTLLDAGIYFEARTLLNAGVHFSFHNENFTDPVYRRVREGHVEVVQMLLNAGADPNYFHNIELMTFKKVEAGNLLIDNLMRERWRDLDRYDDFNGRQALIEISKPFELMTTEVTQYHWYDVMKDNPSSFSTSADCDNHIVTEEGVNLCPNHPVEWVSWNDIQEFIAELNKRNDGYTYRLPTEAEWEYAARAGTTIACFFGNNSQRLYKYAWYSSNSGITFGRTHPVRQRLANQWGFHDMLGNVAEWVQDSYYDTNNGLKDPLLESGRKRVYRGGSFWEDEIALRCLDRKHDFSGNYNDNTGFRLVRIPVTQ